MEGLRPFIQSLRINCHRQSESMYLRQLIVVNLKVCRRAKSFQPWLMRVFILRLSRHVIAFFIPKNCKTSGGRSQVNGAKQPTTHTANGPNQVWCWDITWLPGPAKGIYYYLYLILDIYSRKIVGWESHEDESAQNAAKLIRKAHLREEVQDKPLVLHSDNGSPMKGSSMLETLYQLGVATSFSRPRVSNDNAYAESIFKTCKYRPDYPYKGFESIEKARDWVLTFSHWYNFNHKHSGIKFITPHQRHSGLADRVLDKRKAVYQRAKERNPNRWRGDIRNWDLPEEVHLNPARTSVKVEGVK